MAKKYIQYLETDTLKGYDVLLNDYEKGFTKKEYDEFFDLLKKELVPFVKKITSLKPLDDSFVYKNIVLINKRICSLFDGCDVF